MVPDAEEHLSLSGLCLCMAADHPPGAGAVQTALVPHSTGTGGLQWLCEQLWGGKRRVTIWYRTGLMDQTLGHSATGTVLLMGRVPLSRKHFLIVEAGGHACSSEAFATHLQITNS